MWAVSEAKTGYACGLQVYTGKEAGQQEKGLSYRVVMDLMRPMFGSGLQVYMDNYYTSVDLLVDLLARGINACGTIRSNRKGLPEQFRPKNIRLQRGEARTAQKTGSDVRHLDGYQSRAHLIQLSRPCGEG